jgi:hypothetical protein
MSVNKLKFLVPFAGVVISAGSAYEIGRQQSRTAIEIAKIKTNAAIELSKLEAKAKMERLIAKGELDKIISQTEANKAINNNIPSSESVKNLNLQDTIVSGQSNVLNDTKFINSPLEIDRFKELISNFDLSNLPFETLIGITIFSGTIASLICILFLGLYVTVYKMDLPFENYYSGFMLKLVNFVKPYSDGFIVFYLTLLVTAQMILFLLSLRLLSGY